MKNNIILLLVGFQNKNIIYYHMNYTFILKSDYIELSKLLKFYNLAYSGAEAKHVITEWLVTVNWVIETRIRNKLRVGDIVQYLQNKVEVTSGIK